MMRRARLIATPYFNMDMLNLVIRKKLMQRTIAIEEKVARADNRDEVELAALE